MGYTHDVGGQRGFGPVDPEDDEQLPFHEAWEARIFGVVRSLRQNQVCTPDEWRHSVERLEPATYLSLSYYERWILAAERIAIEKGVLTPGEVDRLLAAERAPEGAS
jgi:nitrile hydratase subunit beta